MRRFVPVLLCVSAHAQRSLDNFRNQVPALMEAADIPGLSVAWVENGKVAWTAAFGRRAPAADSGAVGRDTIFAAASLSKPVFAYCLLRMAGRGEFDLDKPLAGYLPYPRLDHDERYRKITARMVLSHTTGLPNWGGTPLKMIKRSSRS